MAYKSPFDLPDEHIRTAYGQRNAFVHGKWVSDSAAFRRVTIRTKGGRLVAEDRVIAIDELEKAAKTIFDAGEALIQKFREYDLLQPQKP